MKKILSLLLCSIFLLNSSFINIKAESTEISCNPCVAIEGEDYIDSDWISVANGNVALKFSHTQQQEICLLQIFTKMTIAMSCKAVA